MKRDDVLGEADVDAAVLMFQAKVLVEERQDLGQKLAKGAHVFQSEIQNCCQLFSLLQNKEIFTVKRILNYLSV